MDDLKLDTGASSANYGGSPILSILGDSAAQQYGATAGLLCGIIVIMVGWFSAMAWVAYLGVAMLLSVAIWRLLEQRKKRVRIQSISRAIAASSHKARELEFARARARGPALPPALPVAAGGLASGRAEFGIPELPAAPPPLSMAAKAAKSAPMRATAPPQGSPFSARATMHAAANDDVDLPPLEFSSSSNEPPSSLPKPSGASLLAKIALTKSVSAQVASSSTPPPFNGPAPITDDLPPLEFVASGFKNPVQNTASVAAPAKPSAVNPAIAVPAAFAAVKAPTPQVAKSEVNKDQLSSNGMPFDSAKKFEQVSFVDDFLALNGGMEEEIPEPVQRRIQMAQRGDFRVVKVVVDQDDGEKTLHFELYRRETLLKQGGQAEIQAEAKRVIAAG